MGNTKRYSQEFKDEVIKLVIDMYADPRQEKYESKVLAIEP